MPLLVKDADSLAAERIARHGEPFVRLARVERIEPVAAVPDGAIQAVVDGATLVLPLGGVVDLARERVRLAKEIDRLDNDLAKFAAKLANPQFLAKARPEVIEEQREREADAGRDRARAQAAYARLAVL
jgi:valyl-tRNA synthetase